MTLRRRLPQRLAHDGTPEIRKAPIRNDDEVGEKGLFLALGAAPCGGRTRRADAEHAPRELALYELVDGGLYDVDTCRALGTVSEGHYEATVVETAALVAVGVGNVHDLAGVDDAVAVLGDGIDAVETRPEAEFLERGDACGLEELADDAVGFCEGALEEGDAEGRGAQFGGDGGEGVGERRAGDACADDEDVVVRTHVSLFFFLVLLQVPGSHRESLCKEASRNG